MLTSKELLRNLVWEGVRSGVFGLVKVVQHPLQTAVLKDELQGSLRANA